jgi:G3E family GTPase
MSERIPVIVVAGFLGAGKTTFMRHIIRDAAARGLKAAVIVNEFGVADIDSNILREADAELLSSIAGGCACCSGQEEFMMALLNMADRSPENKPDVLLIESSGLADPVLMLDCLTVASVLPHLRPAALVSVVDTERFLDTREDAVPLLLRQLILSDHIILNKIDIAFRPQQREAKLQEIEEVLRTVNKAAVLHPARGCAIEMDGLWQNALSADPDSAPLAADQNAVRGEAAPHAHYNTAVVPLTKSFERATLEALLQQLRPEVWRCKGYVELRDEGLHLLQYVGGTKRDWEFVPFNAVFTGVDAPAPTLVFIGPSLDRFALLRDFGGLTLLPLLPTS